MGMSVRDRIRFNKRRYDIRKYLTIKNGLILTCIITVCFIAFTVVTGMILKNKVKNSTIVYKAEKDQNISTDTNTGTSEEENENSTDEFEEVIGAISDVDEEENNQVETLTYNNMTLTLLGEIMMGGEVTDNLDYYYSKAFKGIYSLTNKSDFTYANFSTNITNLEKIENAKSKYLVTKEVISGLNALGLDCVSIASDHITDYPSDIIKNTIGILENNDIFVAGRQNMPVYFEKGDKKVAIVSTNSVILGTSSNYTKNDISVYSKDNLEKNIKEAKQSADIVIADIHWGREYVYNVTSQMRQIAKVAIDAGADLVVGEHAAGVYPLEIYNGKPIIFSLGYLIGDSDLYVGKESFLFDINISKDKKLDTITMTPIYIKDKKEVMLYTDYDKQKADSYLNQYNDWHIQNGLNSTIKDNKIVITF